MDEVDKTRVKRQNVYGPYHEGVQLRSNLQRLMRDAYEQHHGVPLPESADQYFWDIFNKLARLAISPYHLDSWHDISGYTRNIEESIKQTLEENNE